MQIHARVAAARQRLLEAGIRDADLDARLLAEHVLGWTSVKYLTSIADPEPPGFEAAYQVVVDRRRSREPMAYILGKREFWGLSIAVSPDVLIPRPETELIVEALLARLPAIDAPLRVADVCTGSGCVAIAVAHERRNARVIATDISPAATRLARTNAEANHVSSRTQFVVSDLLDGIQGPFDALLCNPPYVRSGDRPALQPEVRDHEPGIALFGGLDGLAIVRRLLTDAPARLAPGGLLVFEFGCGQDEMVETLVAAAGSLELLELREDLQGIPRVAVTRRL